MKTFAKKHRYFIFLLFVYFTAQFIVNPFGNFPLNDDWSYAKSVIALEEEGKILIGDWPAMTLATHVVWGYLFSKMFGFSFLILRLSTWISTIIGMWFFYQLLSSTSGNKKTALIGALCLLFNPIFYNMTNTFMTDVNFFTLLIIAVYFAFDFFRNQKTSSFILVFVFSILLVLLRQYGIIVPLSFTLACLFLKSKKMVYITLALASTIAVYFVFHRYEIYLKGTLSPNAAYKFSEFVSPLQSAFWEKLGHGLSTRYKIVLIHALIYSFPVSVVFLPSLLKSINKKISIVVFVLSIILIYFLFKNYPLQVGNVFSNAGVGTDTSYETLTGSFHPFPHFYSQAFENISSLLKIIFLSVSLTTLALLIINKIQLYHKVLRPSVQAVFFTTLFGSYVTLILITETFFDRYQIPVIALSIVCFSYANLDLKANYLWSILTLVLLFYVSVFGTKDYFTWNEKKWEAYHSLLEDENVKHSEINAGFEVICWNEGKPSACDSYGNLTNYNYLIQYQKEDSFEIYKEYPFQRFFPVQKDTLRVFKRTIWSRQQ